MLILLDKDEKQIARLRSNSVANAMQTEPMNGIVTLDFVVDYDAVEKMEGAFYVAHRDVVNRDSVQMYKIISSAPEISGISYKAIHVVHDDLNGYGYVRERVLGGVQASTALTAALSGSRWEVGRADPTPAKSVSFYDNSRQECITKILETWDVELGYRLVFSGNKIVKRYIDLYSKRGVDTGRRYAYGSNALEVTKEESQAGLYTAYIGRGKGEQKHDDQGNATGGFGRRIDFKDVVWSQANGDPIDKPSGQEYVEIPSTTALYGYSDGSARTKIKVYQDIEDPAELLKRTYADLLVDSRPLVQFKAVISETGNLELGDSVAIIRKDLGIYYKTRVYEVKRDILGGGLVEVKLGDKLDKTQADFNKSLKNEIKATEADMNATVDSAVAAMQTALSLSMFDDDAYYYRLKLGNEWNLPAGLYTFNRPLNQNPTKGIFIGAGKFAITNTKDSQGRFIWTTFGTGDGFVADAITTGILTANLIKAGVLSGGSGKVTLDMDTGALNIDGDLVYDPTTRKLQIKGWAEIDAATIKEGTINSARIPNLSADKITSGTIDARTINVDYLNASNLNRGTVGTSISNTSGTLANGSYSASISGSATGVNANSSDVEFIYGAAPRLVVKGRIDAQPPNGHHTFELNGMSLNNSYGSCSIKPASGSVINCEGGGVWAFPGVRTSRIDFNSKSVYVDGNGFLKV